MGEDLVPDPSD